MAPQADVFISYSRDDKERVLELAAKLRAAGVSLWIDQSGIDGATLWGEQIVNADMQIAGVRRIVSPTIQRATGTFRQSASPTKSLAERHWSAHRGRPEAIQENSRARHFAWLACGRE